MFKKFRVLFEEPQGVFKTCRDWQLKLFTKSANLFLKKLNYPFLKVIVFRNAASVNFNNWGKLAHRSRCENAVSIVEL